MGYQARLNYDKLKIDAQTRQQAVACVSESIITNEESLAIRKLLFRDPSARFYDSWGQGFYFDQNIHYGIFQNQGGPCGILATVQAFFLKHLLYLAKIDLTKINLAKRENYLSAAITDILVNASDNFRQSITIALSNTTSRNIPQPH